MKNPPGRPRGTRMTPEQRENVSKGMKNRYSELRDALELNLALEQRITALEERVADLEGDHA